VGTWDYTRLAVLLLDCDLDYQAPTIMRSYFFWGAGEGGLDLCSYPRTEAVFAIKICNHLVTQQQSVGRL